MNNRFRLCISALAVLLVLMIPVAGLAQETTSAIRVTVVGPEAEALPGVDVSITDTRTGSTRSSASNASGLVFVRGLPVGGPYTVKASSGSYADKTVTDIDLRLGDTYTVVVQLGADTMEEVIVTAALVQTEQLALGPSSVFGLQDLEEMPHINRDLRDVIRNDPRIYIDPAFAGGAVQCAGANPRFNSLTVDGVRMNDLFGLNSNGYPTERQPFSYDSIEQVAVELAPFDVYYGQFTACNINAVTKSGSNEWHGSAFYDYTSDSFSGDKLEGEEIDVGDYTIQRYGATLGGPIIKDKLFFFLAYEKLKGAELFDRVPTGGDVSGRVVQGVSRAQLDEIAQIARDVYGYQVGAEVKSLPVDDEKITAKLDWDINENHRASYSYNYNDGFSISQADGDDNEYEFSDHYYNRGATLNSHTGALFSNWTDKFSTELRVSHLKLDNTQQSRSGIRDDGVFGEVRVETWNDADGDGIFSRANVYLGTDDSRQANKLDYKSWNYKIAGNYELGDHLLTGGFEQDSLDVYNLFIQHTETENRFDEECNPGNPNGCIDAFREARPDDIYYGNAAPSNDPQEGAAVWKYKINTGYLQDEWVTAGGAVTLVFGLRYDWYTSNDRPAFNELFFERQGYANTETIDGKKLLQPRLGVNWTINSQWSMRGGVGLYSGGNPNVWLSNNFSNDGFRIAQLRERTIERDPPPPENCGEGRDFSLFDIPLNGGGNPIYDIPQCLFDAIAFAEPNSGVNALDPDFNLPKAWKVNLGTTYNFGDDYTLNADFLYTKAKDSAIVVNGTMVQTSTAPDGRPIYTDPRRFNSDYILTNVKGKDARSYQFSVNLSKFYDFGLDWSVGYAYTNAKDVSPMTSSVAFSNFASISVDDANAPSLAKSNYNVPHRFTFRIGYSAYWWGDNRTNFTLVGAANQGRPFSYTFSDDDGDTFGDFISNRHLLYVPDGPNDPLVTYLDGFNQDAFFAALAETGLDKYSGQIAPRNAFKSDWWVYYDLRVEQELPAFKQGHKFAAWFTIKNLCNMINSEWCVLKEASFPRAQGLVDMEISEDGTQYIYEEFVAPSGQGRVSEPSLWDIRIGLTYRF
ncbi:MAG: TonB-dependent receptor [Xanthomonadales bacterium]|nr:TonB-dependent receptor [Gammaproteobacteria bacterium]MBT8052573.1 TonB-dependent receptor [Gammaproteobacteria bacterium]NND57746.1 TonB-dependent receptor [Xanthomonadales bacterium]NNK51461.1 TonB-dependent receptor [Xanthomonadales bacterium]